jgi:hypothetical protein
MERRTVARTNDVDGYEVGEECDDEGPEGYWQLMVCHNLPAVRKTDIGRSMFA